MRSGKETGGTISRRRRRRRHCRHCRRSRRVLFRRALRGHHAWLRQCCQYRWCSSESLRWRGMSTPCKHLIQQIPFHGFFFLKALSRFLTQGIGSIPGFLQALDKKCIASLQFVKKVRSHLIKVMSKRRRRFLHPVIKLGSRLLYVVVMLSVIALLNGD